MTNSASATGGQNELAFGWSVVQAAIEDLRADAALAGLRLRDRDGRGRLLQSAIGSELAEIKVGQVADELGSARLGNLLAKLSLVRYSPAGFFDKA